MLAYCTGPWEKRETNSTMQTGTLILKELSIKKATTGRQKWSRGVFWCFLGSAADVAGERGNWTR